LSPEFFIGTEGEPLQSTLVFNPTSIISYIGLTHICMSCVIVFVGLSITFIKIQAALIENKQIMTKSTRQLQKQVTLVMSIHVITSLILFGIPIGIFCLNGTVYCHYPTFNFWVGAVGEVFWVFTGYLVCLLSINRILEMAKPRYGSVLFDGFRIYGWMIIGFGWGIFLGVFTAPTFLSPVTKTWVYDIYFGFDIKITYTFDNLFHGIHNYGTCLLLSVCTVFLIAIYVSKISISSNSIGRNQLSKSLVRLYIQVSLICCITGFVGVMHAMMQFVGVPDWLFIVAQVAWISVHGSPGCVFLVFNITLRRKILTRLGIKEYTHTTT
uniref:G_PROTEIN_RECEP_F1_2 domain-containing protein n=1 Tax=Rhabditophanes sp. KR3021 TaxID=114890 RepID=A0AC35U7D5_9BILA